MKWYCQFILCLLFQTILLLPSAIGQDNAKAHTHLRKGDELYESSHYNIAEDQYRKAQEQNPTPTGGYNLGNSIYRQERYDEAVEHFKDVTESASDPAIQAKAWHNLGNAYYNKSDFANSVDAYKHALRINPDDLATKENLVLAQQQLRQQQQQQQQNDKSDKDKKQDQDQKQQQQDKQKNQSDEQKNQQPQQQGDQQQPQPQQQKLSKDELDQLLKIMEQEEQKVQRKLRKAKAGKSASGRNW